MKTLFLTFPLLLFVQLTLAQDLVGHLYASASSFFLTDGYANKHRVIQNFSADGNKLIVSGYGGFTFYDLATGETRKIDEFSRTGSTIDLSQDGSLFAEGGSYGNAAITITETKTGKSWLLGRRLSEQRIPPYRPSELEIRLIKEKEQRQA